MKSVSFLKSVIDKESKKTVLEIADQCMENIDIVLRELINKRVAHFLDSGLSITP